jgi:hypothetical protein
VRQQLVIALPRVELTEGIERPQRGGEIDLPLPSQQNLEQTCNVLRVLRWTISRSLVEMGAP